VESTRLASSRTVTGDGGGLVSRGGLVWLAETADLCGLTAGFDSAFDGLPWRSHRPGRTIAQVVWGAPKIPDSGSWLGFVERMGDYGIEACEVHSGVPV
jgi:hypothetical protein